MYCVLCCTVLVTSNQCPGCHSSHSTGAGVTTPESEPETPGTGDSERRMATSLLILLYILAAGYLVFWASLWIVHLMAIIYG